MTFKVIQSHQLLVAIESHKLYLAPFPRYSIAKSETDPPQFEPSEFRNQTWHAKRYGIGLDLVKQHDLNLSRLVTIRITQTREQLIDVQCHLKTPSFVAIESLHVKNHPTLV